MKVTDFNFDLHSLVTYFNSQFLWTKPRSWSKSALIHLINSSMLIRYQLTTGVMILSDPEEKDWESDVTLESMQELSGKGPETTKSVTDSFWYIKWEVSDNCFPNSSHLTAWHGELSLPHAAQYPALQGCYGTTYYVWLDKSTHTILSHSIVRTFDEEDQERMVLFWIIFLVLLSTGCGLCSINQ